ncbi:hypothetical protein CROQUDRAFT_42274 [Cronartium quercuum f. sp. fusiforme G11]|uniref:Molybdopterin synthase sulfur carrier subunit n=1 Tax=Cronartium quercuum f. sp. fusiforme G11 TaxID=708437 RepID=A0A9P6TEK1_9BASI|nr:hypothetical protein CROQUDRAFT_42274 [Cronartium quercuum f. sp. fusiforme G11]
MASDSLVTILLFASARSSVPGEPTSIKLQLPNVTPQSLISVRMVREALEGHARVSGWNTFPDILRRSAFAVDDQMIPIDQEAHAKVELENVLAVIPPVSGG